MIKNKIKTKYVYNLENVNSKKQNLFGIKGAMLGELKKKKINVPDGFIVSSSVFDDFLRVNGLVAEIESALGGLNVDKIQMVEKVSEKIMDLISDGEIYFGLHKEISDNFKHLKTARVIVRPSVTMRENEVASWAGELEYYSNVIEKNLAKKIKECWASLFSPRALYYRYGKKLDDKYISLAVIVQKMINSEVSGICYTRHPITEAREQMVIEAGFGLGAGIIRDKIIPDTYVVKKLGIGDKIKFKKKFEILSKKVLNQGVMVILDIIGIKEARVPESKRQEQKLSDKQIKELAQICQQVEKIFKAPQEIEWALANGKFYIVQTRSLYNKK